MRAICFERCVGKVRKKKNLVLSSWMRESEEVTEEEDDGRSIGICQFVNRNRIGCHVDIGKESLQQQLKDHSLSSELH